MTATSDFVPVSALHHYTIRCTEAELPALRDFYTRVLGLEPGARPVMPAPGYWLYAGGQPIVHLYALLAHPDDGPRTPATGRLDHISFRGRGLQQTRDKLQSLDVAFAEAPIADWPIHQLFLHDPKGLKIELTFFLDEEDAPGA